MNPGADDRPHLRPLREPTDWTAWILALAVIAAAGLYGWVQFYGLPFGDPAPKAKVAPPASPQPQAAAGPRYPVAAPETAASLPTLDESDALLRQALAGLLGQSFFDRFIVSDRLVRRTVATIDNLPRRAAPQRMMPVRPVPGTFAVEQSGGGRILSARNFERYEPFVRAAEAVDTQALVRFYAGRYPLFQRAYQEAGTGEVAARGHFNDRVVEALDDLLAAPEPKQPLRLERRKVLEEYADPALEALSAGQKMMIRMGPRNAARVKAKLREIRRALVAAPQPKG